jgi:hypothetical protein
MNRPSMGVGLLALALACSTVGCATESSNSTTARHGTILTMVNDTPVTVTMKSCPANSPQALQCSAAFRIAPRGSAEFPLSEPAGYPARQVVITGYGRQPRCFLIPPSNLPDSVLAYVTQSHQNMCTGPWQTTASGAG